MPPPAYAGPLERTWYYTFRFICGLIFTFLIIPILIIMPLSFNTVPFFTFTREMLSLDPDGFSLRWYNDFFSSLNWQGAVKNSVIIAFFSTIIATTLGTVAALGLSRPYMPYRTVIMALLISPMIVPLIISAAGMYFFYSKIGLASTHLGVILAHAALGTPFVVITVTATLVGFDHSLTRASAMLGASPTRTFFTVIVPLILPGRDLRRTLRLHHVVRRGGGGALCRQFRAAHHPLADVLGHSRADQPNHPGRRHHVDHRLRYAARQSRTAASPKRAHARYAADLKA